MQTSTPGLHAGPLPSRIDGLPASLPLVSAIIPAYNAAKFIHVAIESALAQTHHLLEIIVVDDGSKDETARIAESYPVTVIRQENGGPASARNTGARTARGEWLAFLDHDDSWHANKTEQQLKYANPDISAVFSKKSDGDAPVLSFAQMFARNHGGNPSSTIIRAEVLRDLGMFDDDRALMGLDDYNLWLRFMLAGYKFAATPNYYDFTPDENHYGGNSAKMLSAELVNIDKIVALANIDKETAARRKQLVLLQYLPDLITNRELQAARQHLRHLPFNRETAKYYVAFLPEWVLNLRRTILGYFR
jgi:glycosyltransferase involved in cell wall biosynthesis